MFNLHFSVQVGRSECLCESLNHGLNLFVQKHIDEQTTMAVSEYSNYIVGK